MTRELSSSKLIPFFLLLFGFLFRLWIGSLAVSEPIFDMSSYHESAKMILRGDLTVECCLHNNGYAVFLSLLYAVFGENNLTAVRITQSMLDTGTGYLLFLTARNLQMLRRSAMITLLLYLFNPLTSSFTGLRLGEIPTIFLMACMAYLVSHRKWRSDILFWLLTGLLLGLLLFLKQSLLSFVGLCLLLLPWNLSSWKKRAGFLLLASAGLLIASSYTLMGNLTHFQTLRLTPPYSTPWTIMYSSFFMPRWPELDAEYHRFNELPQEFIDIWSTHRTASLYEKLENDRIHRTRFLEKLWSNPWAYLVQTARNGLWTWDKYHLFYYHDPLYPRDRPFLRSANIFLIAVTVMGMLHWVRRKLEVDSPFGIVSLTALAVTTFILPLVNTETRLSLYAYPFVFLFAGYAISLIGKGFPGRSRRQDRLRALS